MEAIRGPSSLLGLTWHLPLLGRLGGATAWAGRCSAGEALYGPLPRDGRRAMSVPEIHIRTPREAQGAPTAERQRRDGKRPGDVRRPKRRRAKGQASAGDGGAVGGDAPELLPKRSLLSSNTQSFRHLFSFGSKAAPAPSAGLKESSAADAAAAAAAAAATAGKDAVAGRSAADEDADRVAPFSLFGSPVEAEQLRGPLPVGRADVSAGDGSDAVGPGTPTPGVYVVRDGLAAESAEEILSMARRYCGADRSPEDLEAEWLDGGKKEALREDLRLKRYKRLRGRVLGPATGRDGGPH
jgi:hypothetical protein